LLPTGAIQRATSSSGKSASSGALWRASKRRSASTYKNACSRLRAGSPSRPVSRSTSEMAAPSAERAATTSSSQRLERRSSADNKVQRLAGIRARRHHPHHRALGLGAEVGSNPAQQTR